MNRLDHTVVPLAAAFVACGHTLPQVSMSQPDPFDKEAVPFCEELHEVLEIPVQSVDSGQRNIELEIDGVRTLIQCTYSPEGAVVGIKVLEMYDDTEQTRAFYSDFATIKDSSNDEEMAFDFFAQPDGCVDKVVLGKIGPPETQEEYFTSECTPYSRPPVLKFDQLMRERQVRFEKITSTARNWLSKNKHVFSASGRR